MNLLPPLFLLDHTVLEWFVLIAEKKSLAIYIRNQVQWPIYAVCYAVC